MEQDTVRHTADKCFYHPAEDAIQSCSTFSRFLCAACSHTIKGNVYCQDCLVQGARMAHLAATAAPDLVSPRRAALLAIIPGIGAVYNRQYTKALVHVAVFAGLMALAEEGPQIFHMAAISFWVFTLMDAYRSAQEILRHRLTAPASAQEAQQPVNTLVWGGVLVVLGLIFLLDSLAIISFDFVRRFWPLAFVFLGLYLIYDHYRKQE